MKILLLLLPFLLLAGCAATPESEARRTGWRDPFEMGQEFHGQRPGGR